VDQGLLRREEEWRSQWKEEWRSQWVVEEWRSQRAEE
jgi:hypothetical protein